MAKKDEKPKPAPAPKGPLPQFDKKFMSDPENRRKVGVYDG